MGKRGPKPRDPKDVKSELFNLRLTPGTKELVDLANRPPDFWRTVITLTAGQIYLKENGKAFIWDKLTEKWEEEIARHTEP